MTLPLIPNQDFWKLFKETQGAFSTPEAIALYNIALQAPEGFYLELGTHKGKSTIASAAALDSNGLFWLVEPEFQNEEWECDVFNKVRLANEELLIETVAGYSTEFIPTIRKDLSFVFIDSGVHDDLVMEEVKMLEDMMIPKGIIAFHDYLNQFTAVERAYNYLLSTGKYEVIPIDWGEIFNYVRANNLEDGNISWHEKGSEEFPKFVGAVRRK